MKVCFPTETLQGLDSRVYGHFGSAPGFVIVDTGTMKVEVSTIKTSIMPMACANLSKLWEDARSTLWSWEGSAMGALVKLQAQGITVYRGAQGTIEQNIALIQSRRLPQFQAEDACSGHTGGGCAHS